MASEQTNGGSSLSGYMRYSQEEMGRCCRVISHLVHEVTLGSHRIILHHVQPVVRSFTREHAHSTFEAQLLLDGTAECSTGGQWLLLAPGQVTLHAPDIPHRWRGHGTPFLRLSLWFSVMPEPAMCLPAQWPHLPQAFTVLQALFDDIETRTTGWSNRVGPQVALLLSHILALTEWPDAEIPDTPADTSLLSLLDRFLEDNLHVPLSRREIANYLGISERTLSRQIRRLTGTSLVDHLESLRLTRAGRLLADTETPIETISRFVGYNSPSYFCRRFHRHFGITPGQYRGQAGQSTADR